MFGDADAVSAGRVHDEDPSRARGVEIDVVDPGSCAGNHPKVWCLRDQSFVDFRRAANDQRVGALEIRSEYIRWSPGSCVDGPSGNR